MEQTTQNPNTSKIIDLIKQKKWTEAQELLVKEFERDMTPEERGDVWIRLTTMQITVENAIMREKLDSMHETMKELQDLQAGATSAGANIEMEDARKKLA